MTTQREPDTSAEGLRFRKKPVVIEAMRWDGSEASAAIIAFWSTQHIVLRRETTPVLVIPTLEGNMLASSGDWIIKGVKGEFYPCKPDIFAATYEPALADAAGQAAPVPPPVEAGAYDDLIQNLIDAYYNFGRTGQEQEERAYESAKASVRYWLSAEHDRAEGLAKEVERLKAELADAKKEMRLAGERYLDAEDKLAVYEAPIGDGAAEARATRLRDLEKCGLGESDQARLIRDYLRLSAAHAECKGENTKRELTPADLPPPDALIRYPDGSLSAMMFHFAAEGHRFDEIADQAGYETRFVSAETDLGEDSALWREYENGENILDRWTPAPPDGWTLGGTFGTEDGPCACFIRRAALAPASEEKAT